jgi:hypothetical protein
MQKMAGRKILVIIELPLSIGQERNKIANR